MLQPADPFLDMAGEDLRRRIFLTESETGADAVPAAGIHHSGLPRPHRQPGRHAAPLFLSRRGVPPAPRRRQRILPGRHRGSRRHATPPRADARSIADAHALLALALPGRRFGGHARRPGDLRGGAGRARPAARLAHAARPRLRLGRDAGTRPLPTSPTRRATERWPSRSPRWSPTAISTGLSAHIAARHGGGRPVAVGRPHAGRHRAPPDREGRTAQRAPAPNEAFAALKSVPGDRRAARRTRPRRWRPSPPDAGAVAGCGARQLRRARRGAREPRPAGRRDPLRCRLRPSARLLHRPGLRDRGAGRRRGRWPAAAATTGC